MTYPAPVPGLIIRYNYLWHAEKEQGLSTGSKDRPCAIVVHHSRSGDTIVVPITHSPPELGEDSLSIELPPELSVQLGLDGETNWIRVSEVNRFVWPGIHLRPLPSNPDRYDYGIIPADLFEEIKARLQDAMMRGRIPASKR